MASRGESSRGPRPRRGSGPRRGPPRGGPRRSYRRPVRDYPETERLGRKEIVCDESPKTIVIEFCHNDQGQFIQISEADSKQFSRINMNMDSAKEMKTGLEGLVNDYDNIIKMTVTENAPLAKCDPIFQGQRKYFVDVRENERGKFVKVKLEVRSSRTVYVAFPLENFKDFAGKFIELYDQYYNPQDNDTPPTTPSNLPNSREVRAGGKSFFFDVEKNDRGVFVRLTESVRVSGKRTYINIPNSCWPQMAEVFGQLGQEVPYEEVGSGSEDN